VEVECPYSCGFSACADCWANFFITGETVEWKCMQCRARLTEDFINEHFSAATAKTLWTKRKEFLVQLEKSLVPATMDYYRAHKYQSKWKETMDLYEEKVKQAKDTYSMLKRDYEHLRRSLAVQEGVTYTSEHMDFLETQLAMYIARKDTEKVAERRPGLDIEQRIDEGDSSRVAATRRFQCTKSECAGYVTNVGRPFGSCPVCESTHCIRCREACPADKKEEHTCNPDTLASIEAITNDSKNCPGCGVVIFRTYGCDAMFCTKCHTGFNWVSGRVIRGDFHNPHRTEWRMQQQAGLSQDTPIPEAACEATPAAIRMMTYAFIRTHPADTEILTCLLNTYDHFRFDAEGVGPEFELKDRVSRLKLRALFIDGQLTEAKWATSLGRLEKKREAMGVKSDLFTVIANVLGDELYHYCRGVSQRQELVQRVKDFIQFVNPKLTNAKYEYVISVSNFTVERSAK